MIIVSVLFFETHRYIGKREEHIENLCVFGPTLCTYVFQKDPTFSSLLQKEYLNSTTGYF
jgi:hypothetical protein